MNFKKIKSQEGMTAVELYVAKLSCCKTVLYERHGQLDFNFFNTFFKI